MSRGCQVHELQTPTDMCAWCNYGHHGTLTFEQKIGAFIDTPMKSYTHHVQFSQ